MPQRSRLGSIMPDPLEKFTYNLLLHLRQNLAKFKANVSTSAHLHYGDSLGITKNLLEAVNKMIDHLEPQQKGDDISNYADKVTFDYDYMNTNISSEYGV